jgi:hypothetical protein
VEPDDRYNPNVGIQDQVLSWEGLIRIWIQRRPARRVWSFISIFPGKPGEPWNFIWVLENSVELTFSLSNITNS